MTDTTTTTLGLTKPEVGASEDSWGEKINTNFDLVDDALDGTTAVSLDINGGTIDGAVIGGATPAAITGTAITGTSFATSGDMSFGDNDKAIFGADSDLQIYHDGSNSYIKNNTGVMRIHGTQVQIKDEDNNETLAVFNPQGSVDLYYDNSKKLATTSTGIDVTGTVTADGLTVAGDAIVQTGAGTLTVDAFGGGSVQVSSNGAYKHISTLSSGYHLFEVNSKSVAKFNNNGDISFYEDTGTTPKFFWDASAESLGIGTSSPAKQLHIESSTGGTLRLSSSDASVGAGESLGQIDWYSNDASGSGSGVRAFLNVVENDGGLGRAYDMTFGTGQVATATEHMRITSSGNVGIGTSSSPALTLDVTRDATTAFSGTAYRVARFHSSTAAASDQPGIILGYDTSGAGVIAADTQALGQPIAFWTYNGYAWAERMRIDSSGNLLVGTTNLNPQSSSSDSGMRIGDGFMFAGRSGEVAILNRQGSDGDIAVFRKDGSTVGSIKSAFSSSIAVDGAANRSGLYLATSSLVPRYNSSNVDATVDLGGTSTRFKDLYLSGGVYLGGTGSANKLDDYEEGTWTAQLSDGTNISSTTATGYYTKVGRIVHCMVAQFTNISTSGLSGSLRLSLPFTPSTGGFYSSGAAVMFSGTFPSNTYALRVSIYHGETLGYLQAVGTSGASSLSTSNITSGATDIAQITFSYITS